MSASVFLFLSVYEGACGFLGCGGRAGSLLRLALAGCLPLAPTHLLHQASLNDCLCLQPLDLCNPARTLLLSEELLLYEGRNKAAEVRYSPSQVRFPVGFASHLPGPYISPLLDRCRIVQSG